MINSKPFTFSIYGPNNTCYTTVTCPSGSIEYDLDGTYTWTELGLLFKRYAHYKAKEHPDFGETYIPAWKNTGYFRQQLQAYARRKKNARRSKVN